MIPTPKKPTATAGDPGNMNENSKKFMPKVEKAQKLNLHKEMHIMYQPPTMGSTIPSTNMKAASEHPPFFRNMPGSEIFKQAFSNPRYMLLGALCVTGYSLFSMHNKVTDLEKKVGELEKMPKEQARMWREIDHLLVEQRRGNLFVTPRGG